MQGDAGAALSALNGFNLKLTRAATDPANAFGSRQTSAARLDRDAVGNDVAGIKADAKLTNQLRVFLLVTRQFAHEITGTTFSDGAQVIDGLLGTQANTVVRNRDGLGRLVKRHTDGQIWRIFK